MSTALEPQERRAVPASTRIARLGITTTGRYCAFMSALMTDILTGEVTPQIGNAVVNAGGKLLKAAEAQERYGTTGTDGQVRGLRLVPAEFDAELSQPIQ